MLSKMWQQPRRLMIDVLIRKQCFASVIAGRYFAFAFASDLECLCLLTIFAAYTANLR